MRVSFYRRTGKRLFDVLVSMMVLLAILPILAVTALMVYIFMGRPIFFRQVRPGRDAVPFTILKFRTMLVARPDATEVPSDQVRLTRLGQLLRSTSLDEFPELFNVLRGDMSLVGPRPLLMEYLGRYNPEQFRRHAVLPGITGWAQVNGRNELPWSERFKLDVWYVDNLSLKLDLKILWRTFWKTLRRDGINQAGQATAAPFEG